MRKKLKKNSTFNSYCLFYCTFFCCLLWQIRIQSEKKTTKLWSIYHITIRQNLRKHLQRGLWLMNIRISVAFFFSRNQRVINQELYLRIIEYIFLNFWNASYRLITCKYFSINIVYLSNKIIVKPLKFLPNP